MNAVIVAITLVTGSFAGEATKTVKGIRRVWLDGSGGVTYIRKAGDSRYLVESSGCNVSGIEIVEDVKGDDDYWIEFVHTPKGIMDGRWYRITVHLDSVDRIGAGYIETNGKFRTHQPLHEIGR